MALPLMILSCVTLNVQVVKQALWYLHFTAVGVYRYSEQLVLRITDKETCGVYVCRYVFLSRHCCLNKGGRSRRHMLIGALDQRVLKSLVNQSIDWLQTLTLTLPPFWQCLLHFTCSFGIVYKRLSFMIAYFTICGCILLERRSQTWCRLCFDHVETLGLAHSA